MKNIVVVNIKRARLAQSSVVDRINDQREHKNFVTDINLKQIAIITHKSYSSVYNTYSSLIEELEQLTHRKGASIKRLFAVTEDDLFFYSVKNPIHIGLSWRFWRKIMFRLRTFGSLRIAQRQPCCGTWSPCVTMPRHMIFLCVWTHAFSRGRAQITFVLECCFLVSDRWCLMAFWNCFRRDRTPDVRYSLNMLEEERPNSVTERVGMIYMAVGFLRIKSGHALTYDEQSKWWTTQFLICLGIWN